MKLKNFLSGRIGGFVIFLLILVTAFVISPARHSCPEQPQAARELSATEEEWALEERHELQLAINTLKDCNPRKGCYAPDSASDINEKLLLEEERTTKLLDPTQVARACEALSFAGYGHMKPDSCD